MLREALKACVKLLTSTHDTYLVAKLLNEMYEKGFHDVFMRFEQLTTGQHDECYWKCLIGRFYQRGLCGYECNFDIAKSKFEGLIDSGFSDVFFYLGVIYELGENVS